MKAIRETKIETETVEDVFTCPLVPEDVNSEAAFVVTKTQNLSDLEMTVEEAAKILNVPEIFLFELINALEYAMHNVREDLKSCWHRMDELEKRIEQLEK
jgi:predicted transcriptional regulator